MNDSLNDNFNVASNSPGLTPEEYKATLEAETQQKRNRNGLIAFGITVGGIVVIVVTIILAATGLW